MNCTRCQGSGFLNLDHLEDRDHALLGASEDWHQALLGWITSKQVSEDIQVCDCCGDGENWYGTPGEHNNYMTPPSGRLGPPDNQEPYPECA